MTTLIDYAYPMMQIERRLKDMHHELLNHNFDKAQESAALLITDARLLQNTLLLMKEQRDGSHSRG